MSLIHSPFSLLSGTWAYLSYHPFRVKSSTPFSFDKRKEFSFLFFTSSPQVDFCRLLVPYVPLSPPNKDRRLPSLAWESPLSSSKEVIGETPFPPPSFRLVDLLPSPDRVSSARSLIIKTPPPDVFLPLTGDLNGPSFFPRA